VRRAGGARRQTAGEQRGAEGFKSKS